MFDMVVVLNPTFSMISLKNLKIPLKPTLDLAHRISCQEISSITSEWNSVFHNRLKHCLTTQDKDWTKEMLNLALLKFEKKSVIGKSVIWTDSRLSVKIKEKKKLNILHNWSWVFSEDCTSNKISWTLNSFTGFMLTQGATYSTVSISFWGILGFERLPSWHRQTPPMLNLEILGKILLTPYMFSRWFGWHHLGEQREQSLTRNKTSAYVTRLQGHLAYNWWLGSTYGMVLYVIPCVNSFAFQNKN